MGALPLFQSPQPRPWRGLSSGANSSPWRGEGVIRSGFAPLDAALPGGGFCRGALTTLLSVSGCAPTTSLALLGCATAQRLKSTGEDALGCCAWLDVSCSLHGPGAAAWGVDLNRLLVVQPSREAWVEIALRLVTSQLFDMVVVDATVLPGGGVAAAGLSTGYAAAVHRLALAAKQGSAAVILVSSGDRCLPPRLAGSALVDVKFSRSGSLSLRSATLARAEGWKQVPWPPPPFENSETTTSPTRKRGEPGNEALVLSEAHRRCPRNEEKSGLMKAGSKGR